MRLTEEQYQKLINAKQPKPSKYRNKKVTYDGITFDSAKEANYYLKFSLMQEAGIIKDLELQKKFILQPSFKLNGQTIRSINYYADFVYYDNKKCKTVVVDVKSKATKKDKVYILKKKMFLNKYRDLEFKEID